MDLYTLISTGLDDKLKCFQCKNYLSYFPISICSNHRSICGRCTIPEESVYYHEEALEALCHLLKFPCRYQTQGCSEELHPEETPQHEKDCPFRVVTCVVKKPPNRCNWSGSLPTLLSHCQNEHPDAFLKNGEFEIVLSRSEKCGFLVEHDTHMILFMKKFDSKTKVLQCAVFNPYQTIDESSTWQILIHAQNTTLSHDFKSTSNELTFTKLRLHCIADACGDQQSVTCSINPENKTNTPLTVQHDETYPDILSHLTCIICSNVVVPPVYRCPIHLGIKCSNCCHLPCHPLLLCSKFHQDDLMGHLLTLLKYPCKYQKNGCTYVSLLGGIKTHETNCDYKTDRCILYKSESCNWEGFLKDVYTHITLEHQHVNLNLSSEYKINENDTTMKDKIIKMCGHLFRLVYLMEGARYVLSVQTLCGEKETFKYQIDVLDATNSGQRLSMTRVCAVQSVEEDIFKDPTVYCYIQKDQVCSFIGSEEEGPVLTFKLSIFK